MKFQEFLDRYQKVLVEHYPHRVGVAPLVSVCVHTYQHAGYIRECLESILMQQTDFDFEILLGEDASTDGTREICIEYANQYPDRIRLFLHNRENNIRVNGHPTGRFNFIYNLFNSRGKYIALCEGDDYWTDSYKLQKQLYILKANNEMVACHHWHSISKKNNAGDFVEAEAPKEAHGYNNKIVTDVSEIFKFELRPQTRTLMLRNIFIEKPIPDWFCKVKFGDIALSLILGEYGKFYFIDEPMAVYRITESGASSIFNTKKGYILGNKEWIKLIAAALQHHKYKYINEAKEGIEFFIGRIKSNAGYSFQEKISLLNFIWRKVDLPKNLKWSLILHTIK